MQYATHMEWWHLRTEDAGSPSKFLGADRARLLAGSTPGSGAWIHALPSANMALRFSNEDIRISVSFRLGAPIVSEPTCVCGTRVLSNGHQHIHSYRHKDPWGLGARGHWVGQCLRSQTTGSFTEFTKFTENLRYEQISQRKWFYWGQS